MRFLGPSLSLALLAFAWAHPLFAGEGPNLLSGDFESGATVANPWGGVDEKGLLHVWSGEQQAVDDSGKVAKTLFSPSIAVGDLNGDGLADLVVADARGFFWFFPNIGKANAPAFNHPEIMPIWLSTDYQTKDVVPRLQLVDYDGDGKLDVVAGNYAGELYFIHNNGSASTPDFHMPTDPATIEVPTHSKHLLWRNYLAPFLYDWGGNGRLDLLIGDGSYSANSIYLLTNTGNRNQASFDEEHTVKLIPGNGREDLTPQVVDWNGDGKPDILTGERTGYINIYINQAATKADPPVYGEPQHVLFGKKDKIGALTTVCTTDLNGDKLFDIITSSTDGHISYALNEGTPGNPKFGDLIPFKGTNPYPPIELPKTWAVDAYHPYGAAYEVLECTNAKKEPGFTPPPDFKGQGALKFSVFDPQASYFKTRYVPAENGRVINYTGKLGVQTEASYVLSFWVKSNGISNLIWHLNGTQRNATGGYVLNLNQGSVQNEGSWTKYSQQVHISSRIERKNVGMGMGLQLDWDGDGTVYFDDFSLKKTQ